MYLRCGECFASTWLDRPRPVTTGEPVECQYCAKSYTVELVEGVDGTLASHYNHALKLANVNDIDMASAYSVMLGILTLEEARFLHGVGVEMDDLPDEPKLPHQAATVDEDPATRPAALTAIDPDFLPAVKDGALSFEEALRRGSRDAFAARLQVRHKLTRSLALRVADNRISLRSALAELEDRKPPVIVQRTRPGLERWQTALMVFLAVVIVSAISSAVWNSKFAAHRAPVLPLEPIAEVEAAPDSSSADRRRQALARAVEVITDPQGNVTRIVASDPISVLRAYCEASMLLPPPEAVGITETDPPSRSERMGVFRDFNSLETMRAIRIRRDHRTRRWTAGVGRGPIPVFETLPVTPRGAEVAVSAR